MSDSVELSTILEAILFSAGRSMTVDELMEQTGKTRTEVPVHWKTYVLQSSAVEIQLCN